MSAIQTNAYLSSGARILVTLPDAASITVAAVRDDVETLRKRIAQHTEAGAQFSRCDVALRNAKSSIDLEAAIAAEDGGAIDTKKLAKRVRLAEEDRESARIEVKARESAVAKAHGKLIATIEHNSPALRDAAMRKIEPAILKLATVRKQVEAAEAELAEHFGMIGMVDRIPVDRMPVMINHSKSAFHVSVALGELAASVAAAMESYDAYRGAAIAKPDVVVPVPTQDTVDETTGALVPAEVPVDEFAIVAETDAD